MLVLVISALINLSFCNYRSTLEVKDISNNLVYHTHQTLTILNDDFYLF